MPRFFSSDDPPALHAAIARSRKLLNRRAMAAAAAGAVPIPGLDWAVDAVLLTRLLPAINAQFGLTPVQLDQLTPTQRQKVQKAATQVGSVLIGKMISRDLVIKLLKTVGTRIATAQASKFIPLAGQAVSAMVGYATVRYLGEAHIKDCVRVVQSVGLALPGPETVPEVVLAITHDPAPDGQRKRA